MKKKRFTEEQIARVLKEYEGGREIKDLCRELGITSTTFYNWRKKADSLRLIELMSEWSGFDPKMWGPTIIGFGSYHYKYASGHEGDAPLLGFSPRKSQFSLYVYSETDKSRRLLIDLGKFKMGKSCIYFKKLSDINITVVEKLSSETIKYLNEHHECACRQ